MSKRAGRKSQASNDFLEPKAPINVTASNVGTNRGYNDGAASVSFELPADSPAATSFTVVAYKGGIEDATATNLTGGSSPIVVGGLDSATGYTFKVSATNNAGTSALSSESSSVTITTVPASPAAPTVQNYSGDQTDYVTWTAPATGGSAITGYNWESTDSKAGNATGTGVNVAQEATLLSSIEFAQ